MIQDEEKDRMEGSIKVCHGVMGDENWPRPYCVAKSNLPNRKDQNNMTSSSEYLDEPEVLEKKMEIIANLIKNSKCVTAYTGAGLSRSAGIDDYASKGKKKNLFAVINNFFFSLYSSKFDHERCEKSGSG